MKVFIKRFFVSFAMLSLVILLGSCTLESKKVDLGVSLNYRETMVEGEYQLVEVELSEAVVDLEQTRFEWESLNSSVVKVAQDGTLKAEQSGEAVIRLTVTYEEIESVTEFTISVITAKYTVTYELNGGVNDISNPIGFDRTSLPLTLKAPTKENYDFAGWLLNGEIVEAIPAGTEQSIVLVATWEPTKYAIEYVLDGGTLVEGAPTSFTVEDEEIVLKGATKEGYKFLGWFVGEKLVETIPAGSHASVELTAKWEAVEYSITYVLDGGTLVEGAPTSFTVEDEEIVLKGATKEGYTFLGWFVGEKLVETIPAGSMGNVELTAKWERSNVVISFDLAGGHWEGKCATISEFAQEFIDDFHKYAGDTKTTIKEFHTTSHPQVKAAFGSAEMLAKYHWLLEFAFEELTANFAAAEEAGTLEAEVIKTQTLEMVQRMLDGDTTAISGSYAEGRSAFRHWLHGLLNECMPKVVTRYVASSTDFSKEENKAKFFAAYAPTTVEFKFEASLPTPVKEGYTFLGWFANDVKVEQALESGKLVAKWEKDEVKHAVKLVLNGGQVEKDVTEYVEGIGVELPVPTKEGYVFAGWFEAEDFSGVAITAISATADKDVVVFAKWEVEVSDHYDITYDLAGGEWLDTNITSHEGFVEAFLVDYEAYIKGLGWTGEAISRTEDPAHAADFMGVSYGYAAATEAFFKTDATYSAKWGWILTFLTGKGADLSSTTLLRSNTHALLYLTKWGTWPYSVDLSGVKFEEYSSNLPVGSKQEGPTTYVPGTEVTIPAPVKEGFVFKGWLLNGQAFEGITSSTSGNLDLVASWKKDYGSQPVLEVGPESEFKTLAEALAQAEEGFTIKVAAGTYEGATISVSGITILGPNADVDPNTSTRAEEAVFTSDIVVAADDVVINGIEITGAARIVGSENGTKNTTIKYVFSYASTVNPEAGVSATAPIHFYTNVEGAEYVNLVISHVRYEGSKGRPMILYGSHINGLTIENSKFYGSYTNYNDGIKIDSNAGWGIKGQVTIVGNHFEGYQQYTIWMRSYLEGTYNIENNTFKHCGITDSSHAAVTFVTYGGSATGLVEINFRYNVVDNAYMFVRIDANGGLTADRLTARVNYNKMFNCKAQYFVKNAYSFAIDAANNYYDVTPTAAKFLNATYEPYYTNEADVPVYGQPLNMYGLSFDVNGGKLSVTPPAQYDSTTGLSILPTPTWEDHIFLGWFAGETKYDSIPAGTTGALELVAKWREDAIYVGSGSEDYLHATIAEALAVAKAGDKIIILAGTYAEDITISVADLLIVGPNAGINPNSGTRVEEAVLTGKITIASTAANVTIDGLSFTGNATITGGQVVGLRFQNNYVHDTTEATTAWVETSDYKEGFIYFYGKNTALCTNLVFTNNKFDNVSNVNINISYSKNVTFHQNVFKNFDRDAIRFNHGGYNYGVLAFTENEFVQDSLGGYNGIYFRIYGGPGINDLVILIEGNKFVKIGKADAGLYSGAISARNYQEKGAEIIIKNNEFDSCYNYIRIRNNGTAANHASSVWSCEIENNIFKGLPETNYFANWNASDGATTNPENTVFKANYYLDNAGNVITDLEVIKAKMLNVKEYGTALAEAPQLGDAEMVEFYTISYELEEGKVSGLVTEYTRLSKEIVLPEPTKTNHQFMGWFIGEEQVTSITNERRGNLVVTAKWKVLEGEVYKIEYVFDKGEWTSREAVSREEVVDALFTDYYNWAVKYNNYTGTYEAFCKGSDGKYQSGYWYTSINGCMRNPNSKAVDESGENKYFWNTPEYYYKWSAFFAAFDVAMKQVNASQSFYTDTYAAMIRVYQFADWSSTGQKYFESHLEAFYKATQIPTEGASSYRGGQIVKLIELKHESGLKFLGWYDNPEFTGNPITQVSATDTGDKKFYAKWEEEVLATEIVVSNEITEIKRFETYQLVWSFNPANTVDKRVELSSSNPDVLSVSATGLLTAHTTGKAIITIKALGGSKLVKNMEIEVYADDYFHISYDTESYMAIGEAIKLNAEFIKRDGSKSEYTWSSLNDDIATVNDKGVVSGVAAGVATIRVSVVGNDAAYIDFVVTVLPSELSTALQSVVDAHESNIFTRHDLLIGGTYTSDIYGSISKILFEDYAVNNTYLAAGNANTQNHGGTKTSTEFITVHYTGNMASGATAAANANYFVSNSDVSIHYVTGNDGIFHCLDDDKVAFHAGDGSREANWLPTGVNYTGTDLIKDLMSIKVTASDDAYYEINGQKTIIKIPATYDYKGRGTDHTFNADGTITTHMSSAANRTGDIESFFNAMGFRFKVVDGQYYMNETWWNYSQIYEGRICSVGGNRNSIGIESAVNNGTDLWYTWQKTAQLVAHLMVENDLDITRVVGHHFYTAKNCPQPLLENDLEIWNKFISLVQSEYEKITTNKDVTYELVCNSELVDNHGRIVKVGTNAQVITYTVKVTVGGVEQEITLASAVNGIYSKSCNCDCCCDC